MQQFILPFISLALLLAALLICIRALLSRRFYLWIIPLVLTLGLGVFTFLVLLPLISKNPVNASLGLRGNPIVLYIFDALWLAMVTMFRSALGESKVRRNTRKSRNEYEYLKPRNRKDMSQHEF
ncbi:MAG: hypothetical protein PHO44_04875 [Sphaerochaetaceae bacterium]|jgi:hypothetical protein|nr:hypothetical protein [Sphaerochaetaceae bacterium]MDD3164032.1 hypothetical protein [Sphaerochaetaceae bacterium]MDD4007295.1 hypothetical protein [Sphaerochaetaceae bacterium]MDD4396412.1 hypothetical protein [Sphaerochaetaceae bacterium]